MQPTIEGHISQEEAKRAEADAINTLLQTSQTFQIRLNPKALKTSVSKRMALSLFPKLKNKWSIYKIPKQTCIETKTHTDKKTGKATRTYVGTIHISPLYLGTIDQIRRLSLKIDYDEKALHQDPIKESLRLFTYINTISEIAALATLNAPQSTSTNYKKQLKELKEFYKGHLTAASLHQLMQLINFMSNPVDFIGSIRLVQMSGTTQPKANLVE